jgi:hypothetical protein
MTVQRLLLVSSPTCGWTDLRALVDRLESAVVVGDVQDVDEALDLATTLAPTVLFCSDRMAGGSIWRSCATSCRCACAATSCWVRWRPTTSRASCR